MGIEMTMKRLAQTATLLLVNTAFSSSYDPSITSEIISTTDNGNCVIQSVEISAQDPISHGHRIIRNEIYTPKNWKEGQDPSLFLLPPTGGVNFIDRGYAKRFCRSDIRVTVLTHWNNHELPTIDPKSHDLAIRSNLFAMRHTLEFIGRENLTVLGTSVGALSAIMLLDYEPEIKGAVLIVGGLDLQSIISRSSEQQLTELRRARLSHYGLQTAEEYDQLIESSIKTQLGENIQSWNHKPFFIVTALEDTTVPTVNQLQFNEKLDNAEIVEMQKDHIGAIMATSVFYKSQIETFLKKVSR